MYTKILVRRGSASEWANINPVLFPGECGLEIDTKKLKFGDGVTSWNSLPYATVTEEELDLKADISDVYTKNDVYTKLESDSSFEPKNANIQTHIESTNNPHNVTATQIGLGNVDNTSDLNKPISTATQSALDTKEPTISSGTNAEYWRGDKTWQNLNSVVDSRISSQKGQANGLAPLDATGLIASAYLPSYVDDVLEYSSFSVLPITGEMAKIYVTLDTNKIYRWSGSVYVEVSPSPGSTDSVTEGSTNLYFTTERAQDSVAAALTNTSTVNFSYDDNANSITANVNDNSITNAKITTGIDATKIGAGLIDNTEFGYLNGVTSSIQTQLNGKQATGNYITSLTGDVSANGPGSVASTVNSVGGKTSTAVATSVNDTQAATNVNTPSTIVKRDASGNFSAGTITANLTGTASGNEPPITAGTTAQYFRGDKTFQTLNTTAVAEATNLYYTDTRVSNYINTQKGQPNGLASLDANGLVPDSQLPNMVTVNFGDGSDGAFTVTTGVGGNSPYTLTRDTYYSSLTINSGAILNTAGYKVFVSGTLLNNGTISNAGGNGTSAVGTTPGNAGTSAGSGTLGAGTSGTSGGASPAGTASSTTSVNFSMGGAGGASGTGGGVSNAVSAGTVTYTPVRTTSVSMLYGNNLIGGGSGGPGGGGGAAAAGATPGAGGGGGAGGGAILIWSKTLINNGTITASGGSGGAGGNGVSNGGNGGGGGAGGGGGYVFLVYASATLGTITAAGGLGGAGGGKTGGGTTGASGSNGTNGRVIKYDILSNIWS